MATSKTLLTLRRQWYARLAREGFEDIETLTRNGEIYSCLNRKRMHGRPVDNYERGGERNDLGVIRSSHGLFQLKAEYYRFAGQFLWDHEFKNRLERKIWALHAEGATYREIVERLGISTRKAFSTIKNLVQGPFAQYRQALDIELADVST